MPAQPHRRRATSPEDPWGFGASDGTLVEVRHDQPPEPLDVNASPTAAFERHQPPPALWPRAAESEEYGDAVEVPAATAPVALAVAPAAPAPLDHAGEVPLHPHAVVEADPRYFQPRRRRRPSPTLTGAVAALAIAAGFVWLRAEGVGSGREANAVGTFVLSSQPPGANVTLDGRPAGVTPLALQLGAGPHDIVATAANGVTERLSAEVPAGTSSSRHLLLTPPPAPVTPGPTAPAVSVAAAAGASAPPAPAGTSPSAATTSAATTSPAAPPAVPARGFVSFTLPFDVQVYEAGTFLGSNSGERIAVRPGTHTFTLVNEPLGFRSEETVVVGAGKSVRRAIEARSATLSVNALPWAEVLISGRSYGETPLANISLPIGTYRVTLRHPTLGDREVPVTVRLGGPNRVAVDLRR